MMASSLRDAAEYVEGKDNRHVQPGTPTFPPPAPRASSPALSPALAINHIYFDTQYSLGDYTNCLRLLKKGSPGSQIVATHSLRRSIAKHPRSLSKYPSDAISIPFPRAIVG